MLDVGAACRLGACRRDGNMIGDGSEIERILEACNA